MTNAWNAGLKDLEIFENGKRNLILFFKLYLGSWIIRVLRRIVRYVLLSHKSNQDGWMVPETYHETSAMVLEIFLAKI